LLVKTRLLEVDSEPTRMVAYRERSVRGNYFAVNFGPLSVSREIRGP
jgi:hypothetical protein